LVALLCWRKILQQQKKFGTLVNNVREVTARSINRHPVLKLLIEPHLLEKIQQGYTGLTAILIIRGELTHNGIGQIAALGETKAVANTFADLAGTNARRVEITYRAVQPGVGKTGVEPVNIDTVFGGYVRHFSFLSWKITAR
jgi:hypothetical protein